MPRRPRRNTNKGRNANLKLSFAPPLGNHTPLPMEYFTRFTAAGCFYTSTGTGTGDYNWKFELNSIAAPFANVTTGVTWNNLTPATYQCPGTASLISATMYTTWVVYSAMLEIDVTPQSVVDSCVCTITPSQSSSIPGSVGVALGKPFTVQTSFAAGRTYRTNRDFQLYQRFSAWKLLGLPKYIYMNDPSGNFVGGESSGLPTAPPVNLPWTVNLETGDNSQLTQPLEVRVRVTYFVRLYGLQSASLFLQEPKGPRRDKLAEAKERLERPCSPKNWHHPRVMPTSQSSLCFGPAMGELSDTADEKLDYNFDRVSDPMQTLENSMSKLLEEPVVIKTGEPGIVLRSEDQDKASRCG